ncbi:hypothetical protein QQY66_21930 [Streptomyces sp. DG2A-72]|uniref:hypothetical protein n=1 Tax=Streptomyces sp. DG2A-72 TaxID=3051386 RepID=UPI00265C3BE9|nr:hypothetical protein [Streptomyces sp. DG2A-72]MDO0934219.1 hypothetical protein [Streptomyces sp. DG2A-72]
MNDDPVLASTPLPGLERSTVTPAAAAEILEQTRRHGCNPRKLDSSYAERLARDMSSGSWDDYNPDVLSLCEHGAALQGQHRLEAVIISQVSRSFLIARDVPHAAATIMDCGKARSAATALSIVGVERHSKDISSTVRLLQHYDVERDKIPWSTWRSVVYTNAEIVRFFQTTYRDLATFLPLMTALKKGLSSSPAASLACAYLVHRDGGSTSRADDFFEGLASGTNLDASDPRWVTIRYFQGPSRPRRGNMTSVYHLGILIKTWNLWATGQTWELVYFRPSQCMPDVVNVTEPPTPGSRRTDGPRVPTRRRTSGRNPGSGRNAGIQAHLPLDESRMPV